MAHQHQIAVADDGSQDVVEVVRHAPGELANDLHLGCLGHLALELGFLAIVLEQEQNRGIPEPAQPCDRQRNRLPSLARQPHREVARHRRPTRITANGVGDGRLVLLHDQITWIDRQPRASEARGPAERLVHRQEAAIPVDERETDREHVEQGLKVRRL